MLNTTLSNIPQIDYKSRLAHDMKSPLNIILSSTAILRMKTDGLSPETEGISQYLHYIEQNCHRLLRLANDLAESDASAVKVPKLLTSHCDIVDFTQCTLRDLILAAEQRNIEIRLENHLPRPFFLNFDRDQMERALWNLMINAIKHTDRGGTITLTLRCDNDYIYFGIIDSGSGIQSHLRSSLFDPGVTDHKSEGSEIPSHGLGLSIVQQTATLHRGTVFASSRSGDGSSFTVSISRHLPLTMGNPSVPQA